MQNSSDQTPMEPYSPSDVSYTRIDLSLLRAEKSTVSDIAQKIAIAINVQIVEQGEKIPFVPFSDFDTMRNNDNIFLIGPNGAGKSRIILEAVSERFENIDNIYIINPQNLAGNESGRASIEQLVLKITRNDAVIWDNFPEDLRNRDFVESRRAIETIISKTRNIFLALNPKYLELYRNITERIPEIYSCTLSYNNSVIKDIIKEYGTKLNAYTKIYYRHVSRDLNKISSIIWEKDPYPSTVLLYYKRLCSQRSSSIVDAREKNKSLVATTADAIAEARELRSRKAFYASQFEFLKSITDRRSDVEFLYVVKLCYELDNERTFERIVLLQKAIFDSDSPKEPSRKLSTWIYLSGQHYSMHDLVRDAINLSDEALLKIMSFLTSRIDSQSSAQELPIISSFVDNDSTSYSLGAFLGKNIQLVPSKHDNNFPSTLPIIMPQVLGLIKRNKYFAIGLGEGLADTFPSLSDKLQRSTLQLSERSGEFALGLGSGLGKSLHSLDSDMQAAITETMKRNIHLANGLGDSLGHNYKNLKKKLKDELFWLAEENVQFAYGLGVGVGKNYTSKLPKNTRHEIFNRAEKDSEFARGLSDGISYVFKYLSEQSKHEIFNRAEKDSEFARGLGTGLGKNMANNQWEENLELKLFDQSSRNVQLAHGFGFGLGQIFASSIEPERRNKILSFSEENAGFAIGFGFGLGLTFTYLSTEMQTMLLSKTETNPQLAHGFGIALGYNFTFLTKENRDDLQSVRIVKNSQLARGLGMGFGYSFRYLNQNMQQETFALAATNSELAEGLGIGFGYTFPYLVSEFKLVLFDRAEKDSHFAHGLGYGIGYIFTSLEQDDQDKLLTQRCKTNSEFARGLGYGIGYASAYIPEKLLGAIIEQSANNSELAQGFGEGFGYIFTYMTKSRQEELLRRAERDVLFAQGLGYGIGKTFLYLSQEQKNTVLEETKYDAGFTRGLGQGLGTVYMYFDDAKKDEILKRLHGNTGLAIGFGMGIGQVFSYHEYSFQEKEDMALQRRTRQQQDLFEKTKSISGLSRGFGMGIGNVFSYLDDSMQKRLLGLQGQGSSGQSASLTIEPENTSAVSDILRGFVPADNEFARGLGIGIGRFFVYHSREIRVAVFRYARRNTDFAEGLGVGIGFISPFSRYGKKIRLKSPFESDSKNPYFSKGLGLGIGYVFRYMSEQFQVDILNRAKRSDTMSFGLGLSIGNNFSFLDEKARSRIVNLISPGNSFNVDTGNMKRNRKPIPTTKEAFAKGFGTGIGRSYEYLDEVSQIEILKRLSENQAAAFVFSRELGSRFALLSKETRDKILDWANSIVSKEEHIKNSNTIAAAKKDSPFTSGLGNGLGKCFQYLDEITQNEIIKWAEKNEVNLK